MQFLMNKGNVTPLFQGRAVFYMKFKREITGERLAG